LQAKLSVIASSISGVIGIALAYSGFGVWSLVVKTIAQNLCTVLLLWIGNKWQSRGTFSRKSFKELYGFGSKLLLSGLLDTAYRNIFYLVIGKYYSAAELGLYTRAEQFKNLPSQNLNSIIWRVSYPVLASIPTEHEQIKAGYKKLIKSTMMITFVLMLSMAAVAPNMIIVLIGEKWLQSAVYLQLLCFVSMFYPLSALNLNMLKVKGRSDLFLKLEIIKRVTAVPTIIIGIFWGIKIMILSMMVKALIDYYLNSYYSGTLINYRVTEQIKDILPGLGVAAMTASGIYTFGFALVHHLTPTNLFLVQIIVGTTLFFSINELAKLKDYLYLKEIAMHIIGFGKP
jgi:O-antigen/teichoic acid export membrane protein